MTTVSPDQLSFDDALTRLIGMRARRYIAPGAERLLAHLIQKAAYLDDTGLRVLAALIAVLDEDAAARRADNRQEHV